jgi:phosphate-selective porin OprO/OprP
VPYFRLLARMKDSLRILFVRRANSALISLFVFIFGIGCSFAQSTAPANSAGNSGTEPSAKESAITWDNGMHIRSRNGLAELEIGGMVQADERSFAGPHPPSKLPDFILRRGRLVLLGTSLKRLNFRIMAESQRNGPMVVRDAYVDIKISDGIQIELGKFKSPVGLERLQSARYLTFPDRASVTALIPDRDIGIQLHGDLLKSRVTYMGGLFRGVPDGGSTETSTNHGADGEFRIFTYPFHGARASLFGGLGIGIGVSAGSERGTLPSYVTPGLATFFSYRQGTIADGERTRISPQASYYWRRLSVMAEYALSAQDVRLGGIVQRVSNTAWQTTASFVLTGEDASYTGVTPAHPLNPAAHQWGAFEVAGRSNSFRVDPSAFPVLANPATMGQKADGFEVGLNWYPQKYFKTMFDYAQTEFVVGAAMGNRPTEKVLIIRIQFSYY